MMHFFARVRRSGRFELFALAIVAVAVVWVGVGTAPVDANARSIIAHSPASVRVIRREFWTPEQKHDDELMGHLPQVPTYLSCDQLNGVNVSLKKKTGWCYYADIRTTSDEVVYRGYPDPYAPWWLSLRMPRNPDHDKPCGVWAAYAQNEDGKGRVSDWMLLEDDGTGFCGWDTTFDATTAPVEALREDGTPCTWHVTTVKGGCLVVLEYEGGQSVVALTL